MACPNLVQTFVGNQVPLTVVNLVEVVLMMIVILSFHQMVA